MSPECRNCGAHVTRRYVRVHSPDGETVRCCPRCPDQVRRRGGIEEARGTRRVERDGPWGGER